MTGTNDQTSHDEQGAEAAAEVQAAEAAEAQAAPAVDPAARDAAIAEFWGWWASGGAESLDRQFRGEDAGIDVRAEVGGRIAAIDPGLMWAAGPGETATHRLTVTAGGTPPLLAAARRWLHAAPEPDGTWEFLDVVLPDPDPVLRWPGGGTAPRDIDAREALVEIGAGTTVCDVRLFHPAFAELPEAEVAQVGFTLLQKTLGEEGRAVWLRGVAFSAEPPADAVPLPELPDHVAAVAESAPAWYGIEGGEPGAPVHVTARCPLTPLVNPLWNTHVAVQLLYSGVDAEGMPTEESLAALDELGRALADSLGDDGVFVAAETADGVRLLHFYVDGETDAEARLRSCAARWSEGEHDVLAAADPGWLRVGHLRV
ncbi:DUF695 domain-containing protein [Corynebacterium sp. 335C]